MDRDLRAQSRYVPHARQAAVHEAPEADVWAAMGYGNGKTTMAVYEALSNAVVQHPGYEGIVAAPTYPLLYQSWVSEWRRLIPSAWYRLSRDSMEGPHIDVHVDQGVSRIWLRSTVHVASLEGINAAWLVYDEATRERSMDPIRVLMARIRRGYPGRQRRTLVIGPPSTRKHWTATDYGTGPDATHSGDALSWSDGRRRVVRGRTCDNPHLPPGYETALRSRAGATKAWCKQWLDAQFGSVEGQVYEAFSSDVHVVRAADVVGRVWSDVIAGVDWGFTHPGVFLVVAFDGASLYVIHEEVHAQKVVADTRDGWLPLMLAVCKRFGVRRVFCDPSQPGNLQIVAAKLRGVARVYAANNDVGEGIRRVNAVLEWAADRALRRGVVLGKKALYVSDACTHTIAEFEGYSRRKARDGSFTEDVVKLGDDAMDALRYAVMELSDG